ncbi:MAG: hypothetical protein JO347_02455, partial [Candidatus Eremiobacteraeota bacterium]|nr:hypothetical protein [Candidatus Eremiobacteraeota bacterium]
MALGAGFGDELALGCALAFGVDPGAFCVDPDASGVGAGEPKVSRSRENALSA